VKLYKVLDLSYSDDPAQHLKEVGAYHEGDGWRLLTVVYAAGRWLYYLERDVEPAARGVRAEASGGEQGLQEPVRLAGDDPRRGDEHLARRLEGHLARWGVEGTEELRSPCLRRSI
jgi:hypothetical protein